MKSILLIIIVFIHVHIYAQSDFKNSKVSYSQFFNERYIANQDGTIMMKVNIWGHIQNPGMHIINDGTDFASLLSIAGGPLDGANLKSIRLYREIPDKNGKIVYDIDLDNFIRTGSRSNFISLNPNDTIIIPQKFSYSIFDQIGALNAIFSAVMIFLQIQLLTNN